MTRLVVVSTERGDKNEGDLLPTDAGIGCFRTDSVFQCQKWILLCLQRHRESSGVCPQSTGQAHLSDPRRPRVSLSICVLRVGVFQRATVSGIQHPFERDLRSVLHSTDKISTVKRLPTFHGEIYNGITIKFIKILEDILFTYQQRTNKHCSRSCKADLPQ